MRGNRVNVKSLGEAKYRLHYALLDTMGPKVKVPTLNDRNLESKDSF